MGFHLVVAADKKGGIGQAGALPWKLKADMRYFKELTTSPDQASIAARYHMDRAIKEKRIYTLETLIAQLGGIKELPKPTPGARNAVVMGRKTWNSLPERFRPLPDRLNCILSRSLSAGVFQGSHRIYSQLNEAVTALTQDPTLQNIYIIGGGEIYSQALQHPSCAGIFITDIEAEFPCDTFLPSLIEQFQEISTSPFLEEDNLRFRFRYFERKDPESIDLIG